jgi:hypothetical protein
VVPPALLDFSAGVLREKFGSAVRKPVFTFSFDRYRKVTPQLLMKLQTAKNLRAVVVASPTSIKSFMLKFIEICHYLNRQQYIIDEQRAVKSQQQQIKTRFKNIKSFFGFSKKSRATEGLLTEEDMMSLRDQTIIAEDIFSIFDRSIEIMDEVDVLLHPLKSELNWPLGKKEPLDFTQSHTGNGLRWAIPSHLFDAIFSCCGMPIITDIADSRQAGKLTYSIFT